MDESLNIAIIGAGVVGLSTALCIQDSGYSGKITIFANKFNDDTLSAGAGGIFRPDLNLLSDQKHVRKWCEISLQHFMDIIKSAHSGEAGVQLVSGYYLSSNKSISLECPLLKSLLPRYRHVTEKELSLFPSQYKHGMYYTTVIADCRYYLKWMKSKFEKSGGLCIEKHISHLSEIPEDFDVIVNCSGLGAKKLLNDDMLVPIRGQTIKVKAPWIKHFYYGDELYICPGLDYVTLGGVKDYSSWNMNVNPYQKEWIWDKCTELVPSLKNAEIMWDWVGLRPYRNSVRVDASIIKVQGKYRKLVNNYGHGAHGVALSWGTAKEAADLVQQILTQNNFKASL